jgi:hypothetical protein
MMYGGAWYGTGGTVAETVTGGGGGLTKVAEELGVVDVVGGIGGVCG